MTKVVWTRVADIILMIKSLVTDDCHVQIFTVFSSVLINYCHSITSAQTTHS